MPGSTRVDDTEVSLELASEADRGLLTNLLELYIHDLSEIFAGVELGPDGRFGYPRLPLYWSTPEQFSPFLIRKSGKVAGFVLAQRGSPLSDDPEVFDVAEFFVLRSARRSGVGARAARLLWDRLPGRWMVRVSEANRDGLPFWMRVIQNYAGSSVAETQRPGQPQGWRVFAFDSRPNAALSAP